MMSLAFGRVAAVGGGGAGRRGCHSILKEETESVAQGWQRKHHARQEMMTVERRAISSSLIVARMTFFAGRMWWTGRYGRSRLLTQLEAALLRVILSDWAVSDDALM